MKRKLLLLSFLISFISLSSRAFAQAKHYDFKVDGIYYKVVDESKRTVIVTSEQKPSQANLWQAYAGTKPSGAVQITTFVSRPGSGSYQVIGIDDNAFKYCIDLESVSFPSGLSSIGKSAFLGCSKLKAIALPKDIKKINASTFQFCHKLESVKLPDGLEQIDGFAFLDCNALKSIVLPEGVKSIGKSVFKGCSSLTEVKCFMDKPVSVQRGLFKNINKSKVTLYVPKSSLSKYKQAAVWKEFTNMKGFEKPNENPYYSIKIDGIYYYDQGNAGRMAIVVPEQNPSKHNGRAYSTRQFGLRK